MNITCFWLEPVAKAQVSLRRYGRGSTPCGLPQGYHDANAVIEAEIDHPLEDLDRGELPGPRRGVASWDTVARVDDALRLEIRADPRWPAVCACGYAFVEGDEWQRNVNRLHVRSDTGALVTLRPPVVGAMWDAPWLDDEYKGPDGKHIIVMTPGGEWCLDGPASNGGKWSRTGIPPKITVAPSISIGKPERYHGWLRDGVLVPA